MARDLLPSWTLGPSNVLSIYGADGGLIVESPGEVHTDIYGLETCTAVFKAPQDRPDLIPPMFAYHPVFTYLNMERRRVSITPGYLIITGEFAGIPGGTIPIYELSLGCSDEPIETHPRFISEIGGRPSAPMNGAIFIDPSTGRVTASDAVGVFDHFKLTISGTLNPLAGISAYLEAAQMCWRERYCATSRPSDTTVVGHIQSPAGPAPNPPSGGNWLYMGVTYEQRGNCFFITREWRASGRRGWNELIYRS
jgi:hypothetical protein